MKSRKDLANFKIGLFHFFSRAIMKIRKHLACFGSTFNLFKREIVKSGKHLARFGIGFFNLFQWQL